MADNEPKADKAAASPPPPAEPADSSDALEKSPEASGGDGVIDATGSSGSPSDPKAKPPKKPNGLKKFFHKVNVYLLGFILLLVIGGAVTIVNYLNSKKAPPTPNVATQQLTESTLKNLANSNATVGSSAQTLTIQGNAVFSGQVLIRSSLAVAGNIQSGTTLIAPNLTISGNANLPSTQISKLQVSTDAIIQGAATLGSLNVSGVSSFSQPVTASQITVTNLILSGKATLQIPNHISFTGPSPSRSINPVALGSGGTASVNGSDNDGTININTGNNPAAGCFTTITFATPFASPPHIEISPVGLGAGETQYYVNRSTTSMSICTASPAPGNQVFAFDYFVTD